MDPLNDLMFSSHSPTSRNKPGGIDLLNDETFGSGAVNDDWEGCHDNYVEQQSRNGSISSYTKPLDDEELELSNQKLAAAVEELVLNSDQDQDVIDPAILSLRKESRTSSYSPNFENLMSPYMGEEGSFGRSSSMYSPQNPTSSVFQNDGLRNIWNTSETDIYSKSPSMAVERQLLNEKLRNMMKKSDPDGKFEDSAILTAVPSSSDWRTQSQGDVFQPMFNQKPIMMKAEDLEKEMSKSDIRSPSPTYGISIPKKKGTTEGQDRSLPARSVSPVIGSPSSYALPIGTPPKHVTDMLKQFQGFDNAPRHSGPIVAPSHQQQPRHGFHMPPNPRGPNMWPPGMMRPPMNPLIAQDIMNKFGMNKNFPMMVGSPPRNMSPIGSPHVVRSPHMGHGPMVMRPIPIGMRGPMRIPPPYPNQRMPFPPPFPILRLGPGHLHPEHSRFVRMRRQQRGHNRPFNNHQRYHRDNRDPYSNLMLNREKEWVVKIQMMALQSDRPEIDDYYYQHYIDKKLKQGNLSLDNENPEQKRLFTPTKANPDIKKYSPVQYDNSLGKLTVSSVYNPRQIIDVIHADKEEDQSTEPVDVKMSMNKRLEIYSVIEKSYSILLDIEEKQFRAAHGHIQENKDGGKDDENRLKKLEQLLLPSSNAETLAQCLRLRKGKRLICRVLAHMSQDICLQIILTLIKQLPLLIKKDIKENLLHEMYTPVCETMCKFDIEAMVEVIIALSPLSHSVYRDKFGLSLLCKILTIASKLVAASTEIDTKTRDAWSSYLTVCTKIFLSLTKKSKTFSPTQTEEDALTVLENNANLFLAGDSKIAMQLKEIRDWFVTRHSSEDDLHS